MAKIDLRKLTAAVVLGGALVVPTLLPADAMAQGKGKGKNKHGGRHDNGLHKGWYKNGKARGFDDLRRSDDPRWEDRRSDDRRRAQTYRNNTDRRQQTKNEWRNLAYLGGAAGLYGLLTGNKTVAALGLGGGLYSLYRYEQDRKSQSREAQARYQLFNRNAFDYNGNRYVRRTRTKDGQRYYYFQRQR
ncbi:hypothetical protein EON82_06555 [bacterium]|nr:MAG: hypothetical protein EON82_06555 [bacterium]